MKLFSMSTASQCFPYPLLALKMSSAFIIGRNYRNSFVLNLKFCSILELRWDEMKAGKLEVGRRRDLSDLTLEIWNEFGGCEFSHSLILFMSWEYSRCLAYEGLEFFKMNEFRDLPSAARNSRVEIFSRLWCSVKF